jgi:hypothetical protein
MSNPAAKTAQASSPQPAPASIDDLNRLPHAIARAERRLRVLEEIGEIGMRLMRKLEDAPAADTAADFAKLSRAVRLTLDLERHIEEDLFGLLNSQGIVRAAELEAGERLARQADEKPSHDAKSRVADQVGVAIVRETESESERGQRYAAMVERLDWDDAYGDVRDRPLREVVEQLCGDLGLAPDWSDWTDAGWPEAAAARPGARPLFSPFRQPSPTPILERVARSASPYALADP